MVWGGITTDYRTALLHIPAALNGANYVATILQPHVAPFKQTSRLYLTAGQRPSPLCQRDTSLLRRTAYRCHPSRASKGDETVDVGHGGDHRARSKLLERLITGDETWLHLSTPETKRDSMTWKHPSSPVTKKFKVHQSATKMMATVFLDSRGMIFLDILPKRREGQC
ncbi:transposase [Plakobranchus ocellatus]|uniref:Transposase n=1 Tax=Plakobranchus ocellatus TaxID=259542 RepID=A0AAV3ZUL3_9GAST|nr:transposase [Plakobranchus ocellatus]